MEGPDGHGLRHQVGTETIAAVEGHEEAQSPEEVGLIVLLGLLPDQTLLETRAAGRGEEGGGGGDGDGVMMCNDGGVVVVVV